MENNKTKEHNFARREQEERKRKNKQSRAPERRLFMHVSIPKRVKSADTAFLTHFCVEPTKVGLAQKWLLVFLVFGPIGILGA